MPPITSWDDYFIPGTTVLANKLGLADHDDLQLHEAILSGARITELLAADDAIPLDYTGFQLIHRHIFQDIYAWAGEPRTTPTTRMTKSYRDVVHYPLDDLSAPDVAYGYYPGPAVAEAAHKCFSKLEAANYLQGLSRRQFVAGLAEHWAEINTVHAFREGNTRCQVVYFAILAARAGHQLRTADLLEVGPPRETFVAARFHAQATATYELLTQVLSTMVE